jgi:hypothetical protein
MVVDILWLSVAVVCFLVVLFAAYSARKTYISKTEEMKRSIASYRLMEERADAERRKARDQRLYSAPVYKTPDVKSSLTSTTTKKKTTSTPSNGYARRTADDSDDVTNMIMMNNMVASMDTTPSYSFSSPSSDDSCSRSSYESSSSSSSYSSYSSSDSSSSYSSSDSGSSSSGCD